MRKHEIWYDEQDSSNLGWCLRVDSDLVDECRSHDVSMDIVAPDASEDALRAEARQYFGGSLDGHEITIDSWPGRTD